MNYDYVRYENMIQTGSRLSIHGLPYRHQHVPTWPAQEYKVSEKNSGLHSCPTCWSYCTCSVRWHSQTPVTTLPRSKSLHCSTYHSHTIMLLVHRIKVSTVSVWESNTRYLDTEAGRCDSLQPWSTCRRAQCAVIFTCTESCTFLHTTWIGDEAGN
jgi:hypothetical protein